ncbi:hypothetical protein HKBW3S06_00626, partial [Candidatus Hakubella thermalkaliphila]
MFNQALKRNIVPPAQIGRRDNHPSPDVERSWCTDTYTHHILPLKIRSTHNLLNDFDYTPYYSRGTFRGIGQYLE